MANGDDPGVPVADAIELLRDELEAALAKGAGRPVQFRVPDVTLTVSVVAGKSKDAVGKIRWWVIEAGGSGKLVARCHADIGADLAPGAGQTRWDACPAGCRCRRHREASTRARALAGAAAGKWPTGRPRW